MQDNTECNAKAINQGFNGNKAVWNLDLFTEQEAKQVRFDIKIRNISLFPAIAPQIYENGEKARNCNVICSEPNDKHYIPSNESGRIILVLDKNDLNKTYFLRYQNPFGCCYEQMLSISNRDPSIILIDGSSIIKIL